ncbi:UDP-glucuronate 4-epimerase 1 [Platanthera guangdongensis]|uniref:UDP-glucuronate 4-epimerase 1 n=1 Tax=Platanthera guangdongensis TaxID=2320717 RepID=A0ABR2LU79_9ASPA
MSPALLLQGRSSRFQVKPLHLCIESWNVAIVRKLVEVAFSQDIKEAIDIPGPNGTALCKTRMLSISLKNEIVGSGQEEELFPSRLGKVKIKVAHAINKLFHGCFASTSTMFLCAFFLITLTTSYFSFQSFISTSSCFLSSSEWDRQIRASTTIFRSQGFFVLVTGATGFVGSHYSLALHKRDDDIPTTRVLTTAIITTTFSAFGQQDFYLLSSDPTRGSAQRVDRFIKVPENIIYCPQKSEEMTLREESS